MPVDGVGGVGGVEGVRDQLMSVNFSPQFCWQSVTVGGSCSSIGCQVGCQLDASARPLFQLQCLNIFPPFQSSQKKKHPPPLSTLHSFFQLL